MPRTLHQLFRRSSGAFERAARSRGVKARVARDLESAAKELYPDHPEEVLTSRRAFERVAMHTVIGDAGNLELCFGLVDVLASTVETLGLARASDVPDPFRRVWVFNEDGARMRGVVVRCEAGKVAVFCPPSQSRFTKSGNLIRLSYRGFSSSVEYELRLNDAVRLPGALVLHLTRPDGEGAIGRDEVRLDVDLEGQVRALSTDGTGGPTSPTSCRVLDMSVGGLRIASEMPHAADQQVEVELLLPGQDEPLKLDARVCWNRSDDTGQQTQGLQFTEHSTPEAVRYKRYLSTVLPADQDNPPALEREAQQPKPQVQFESMTTPPESLPVPEPARIAFEPEPIDSQKVEELSAELCEREAETERLAEQLAQLHTNLAATEQRTEMQKGSIEDLTAALEESKLQLAAKTRQLTELGATTESAVSLILVLKQKLESLEGTLSTKEPSEKPADS